jgi:RNA polymerase sigma-70 factor (ECF subfamily)
MSSSESPLPTDRACIQQVLQGRPQPFNVLVARYQRLVKAVVWNFFRSPGDLDDICQEVFLKAFLNLTSLQDPDRFKSWLLKIACRTCIDVSRKNRMPIDGGLYNDEGGEIVADNRSQKPFEEFEARSLLGDLPPLDGLIVWLKYVEDQQYADIAIMTGLSEASARQKASRALRFLRERTAL